MSIAALGILENSHNGFEFYLFFGFVVGGPIQHVQVSYCFTQRSIEFIFHTILRPGIRDILYLPGSFPEI